MESDDVQKNVEWIHLPQIETNENSEILMIVLSRTDNFGRRNVLRKTWMNKNNSKMIGDGRMKALFLVGIVPGDEKLKYMMMEEAKLYKDLIIVDLNDQYTTLTYKTITLLLFGINKAAQFQLIGKIDEDVMFFPDEIIPLMDRKLIETESPSIYGEIVPEGGIVNHEKNERWYVPESSFKCKKYPSYLSGPFYLLTKYAATQILSATKHRNFISVEDVFITGILADDVGVIKKNLPGLFMLPETNVDEEGKNVLAWHTSKNNDDFLRFFNIKLVQNSIKRI
uniref:Hexosyltransferase n=1 Tax=Caenorhabditis tropicalis TaxID=1561998 RepID=A0A1I7TP76_9PELO